MHFGCAMCLCYFGLPVAYMLPFQSLVDIQALDRELE